MTSRVIDMKKKEIINIIGKVSEGLFETVTDVLLLGTYLSHTYDRTQYLPSFQSRRRRASYA